jgi:hypothetical protein
LYKTKEIRWNDVLRWRRSAEAKKARQFLMKLSKEVRPSLGASLSSLVVHDAQEAAKQIDTASSVMVSAAAGVVGIAVGAISQLPGGTEVGASLGFGLGAFGADRIKDILKTGLELFGVESRVNRIVARLVLHGDRRILLDTPYLTLRHEGK